MICIHQNIKQGTTFLDRCKVQSHGCFCTAGTAAILAIGGSKPTVTVDDNGRFGVQKVMKVNLTCDHRIVYGAGAAEFMVELKSVIENPEQLTF